MVEYYIILVRNTCRKIPDIGGAKEFCKFQMLLFISLNCVITSNVVVDNIAYSTCS